LAEIEPYSADLYAVAGAARRTGDWPLYVSYLSRLYRPRHLKVMHVAEIWRYPVKSMGGERLRTAILTMTGIPGDRQVQVRGPQHRVVSARRYPRLLGLRGGLTSRGEPTVDGRHWAAPEVLSDVQRIAGPDAHLQYDNDPEARFDVLPLLVATDGAITAFAHDRRRLRPNLVIGGVGGLEERTWPGAELRVGDAVIAVRQLRARCVMTTVDPDTLEQNHAVLRRIVECFDGRLALDCAILRGGTIHEGQPVTLHVRKPCAPSHDTPTGISRM
jgi:hypothetical protein